MATTYTVSVVCSGNICRSPIGEILLRDALTKAGLGDQVVVTSAGTGEWHLGDDMDHRAREVLTAAGHRVQTHQATQFGVEDFATADLVLAMDGGHYRELQALAPDEEAAQKVHLVREFDPEVEDHLMDVVDPYYGDRRDFDLAYAAVVDAVPGILDFIRHQLGQR